MNMSKNLGVMPLLTFLIFSHAGLNSYAAMSIDEYLTMAQQKNPLLKSFKEAQSAAELKVKAVQLDLAPILTAGYLLSKDQSRPSQMGTVREMTAQNVALAKKFSTGTQVKVEAQTGQFENTGVQFPGFDKYSTGLLGVSIQQSLWKDFFGSATRMKIDRQEKVASLEKLASDLQFRAALFEVESTFLDYAVAQEEFKIKKSNLERAQKIEKWTSNRVGNGISDRADLMNAKALVALREVQLLNATEELKTQEMKFRDQLHLAGDENTPEIQLNLNVARPYLTDLMKSKNVTQIESLMAQQESEIKSVVAVETVDSLKPDLQVFGTYATTAYDRDYNQAISQITKTDYPKSSIGVNLTWIFETDAKSSLREAAQKEALASQLKAEKKSTVGRTAWEELVRKYSVLKNSTETLAKVSEYQRERARVEQDKLAKGRTVTSVVVTAESEAADAEINLLKIKSQLRKLETSSLLYLAVQE